MKAKLVVSLASLTVAALLLSPAMASATTGMSGPGRADTPATIGSGPTAGYFASFVPSKSFDLSLTVAVPTISCDPKTPAPILINGLAESDDDYVGGGLTIHCARPTDAYTLYLYNNVCSGNPPSERVAAGDTIRMVEAVSTTVDHVTLTDTTTGKAITDGGACRGFRPNDVQLTTQAGDGPGRLSHFPVFTPVVFSAITVNAQPFSQLDPAGQNQVSYRHPKHVLVKTSALSSGGQSFTNRFVTNS